MNREMLRHYLDDSLSESDVAQIEQSLRASDSLRRLLRSVLQERDRGEHSLGAIWRRDRLTCPSREQLGSYLLEALDDGWQDYVNFHLHTVSCPYCLANLADLKAMRQQAAPQANQRRKRIFDSSAGYLQGCKETGKPKQTD